MVSTLHCISYLAGFDNVPFIEPDVIAVVTAA
jgi:hypothetical protein